MIETTHGLKKIEPSDNPDNLINSVINGNTDIIITELNKKLEALDLVAGENITLNHDIETGTITISTDGTSGKEVQIQNNGTYIQWKYSTEAVWSNLIALADLKGAKGESGTNGYSPTATVSKVGNIATISVTDKNGTTTATIRDGTNGTGEGSGTYDYLELVNKPTINAIELSGNKTSTDLGLADKVHQHNISDVTVNSSIIPTTTNLDIGSATNRFKNLYCDEAHLSTNTLYIGDTPLIGTAGSTINIQADADQIIDVKTKGTGSTRVSSVKQVEVIASGTNAIVNVQSANQLNIQAPSINIQGTTNTIQGDTTFTGNVNIQGTTTSVNATNLEIKDNIIELNKGEVGSGISKGSAGIKIDRGDSDAQYMVFDESDDRFKVGTATSKQTLAYKSEIPTVTNDLTSTLKSDYDTAYTHSQSTHAPTNAQKNSDITKAEIEAKLTGKISTHSHASNVVNTATQVESDNKALNAVQLNPNVTDTLANKINVLNELSFLDRGYITDANTAVLKGKYNFVEGCLNVPYGIGVLFIIPFDANSYTQLAFILNDCSMHMRQNLVGNFSEWGKVLTSKNVDNLYGKKLVTYGDSITQQGYWQPYVVKEFGFNHANLGISGSTMGNYTNPVFVPMCDDARIQAIKNENPDIVTILCGINDMNCSVPIGDISQFSLALTSKNKDTFIGAYSYVVETLLNWKPSLRIILMTTMYGFGGRTNGTTNLSYLDYASATREVANYYSIPVVDFKDVGFNKCTQYTYFQEDFENDTPYYVHPNELGGKRMAELIIPIIKKVLFA